MFFWTRRNKYIFHPNIKIGKNVRIGKSVGIEILYGGKVIIGNNTEILDGCKIWTYGGEISIGDDCSINPHTLIYGNGGCTIGDNVLIAANSMIVPANHKFSSKNQLIRQQGMSEKGILIEDDVWIAHSCTILDGVKIGEGAVIAANSVVNKNIQEYTINAGTPARLIKKRS